MTRPSRSTARAAWPGVARPWPRSRPARRRSIPGSRPLASEFLDGRARERLRLRLTAWLQRHLEACLAPLYRAAELAAGRNGGGVKLGGPARGLLFQLIEALGLLPPRRRRRAGPGPDQGRPQGLGCARPAPGAGSACSCPICSAPAPVTCAPCSQRCTAGGRCRNCPRPPCGRFRPGPGLDEALCRALGYRRLENGGAVALRADALERLAHEAYRLSEQGFFALTPRLTRLVGCDEAELETVLVALRYRVRRDDTGVSFGRAPAAQGPRSP